MRTLDPEVFRFITANLMASLMQRHPIDTSSPEATSDGINALAEMAAAAASRVLTITEGLSVLVVDENHPFMVAFKTFGRLADVTADPLHPAYIEGELVDAAFALARDEPGLWADSLTELDLRMPDGDEIAVMGRARVLCNAAAFLMAEGMRQAKLERLERQRAVEAATAVPVMLEGSEAPLAPDAPTQH